MKLSEIKPLKGNPRQINEKDFEKLKKSIKDFEIMLSIRKIIIDENNEILAGNMRYKALKDLGYTDIKDEWIDKREDLSPKEKKEFIIKDNLQAGEWDWDLLANEWEQEDLEEWGLELNIEELEPEETEGDDDIPEVKTPITVKGDLWELGKHRVLCGDSTVITDVEKLMDGKKADMIHTDPPYGIGYGGSMKLGTKKFGWKQHNGGWDEDRPPKEFFNMALAECENIIIWGGNYFADYLQPTMGWLVWDKGQRDFSLADGEMAWTSFNNAMRIKEYSRAKSNKEERFHATQKPIELIEWAFKYADRHSKKKPINILDYFLGSGSTLIACEKTNRICYGLELDEHYCDVIMKRYIDFCEKNNREIEIKLNGKKYEY